MQPFGHNRHGSKTGWFRAAFWGGGAGLHRLYDTTCLSIQFDNRLYRVYKRSIGCQTRLTIGLTTGCIVYTAGYQTVAVRSTGLSNRLYNLVWQPIV